MPIVTVKPKYSGGSCALVENGRMCGKPIKTRGKCSMHWARVQRHGSPFAVKNNSGGTPLERFMRTTERRDDGCLAYTGTPRSDGYGAFWTKETGTVLAHKWLWEQINGPVPEGMTLDHECHNEAAARGECRGGNACPHRACTDLSHLAVKSPGDNVKASANWHGHATHCPQGHPYDEVNTYRATGGGRACRECHRTKERDRQRFLKDSPRVSVPGDRPLPTHCKFGHEFTAENTRVDTRSSGTVRICRACQRERQLAGKDRYNATRRLKRRTGDTPYNG
jgi:hypothetical protein